jgi:hypothetical protein
MSEEKAEKDNFFLYIAIGVGLFAVTNYMVKTSEGAKYDKAKQLIAENPSNSAYSQKTSNNTGE